MMVGIAASDVALLIETRTSFALDLTSRNLTFKASSRLTIISTFV